MVTGLLHSTSICPPHSPTRITKNSTLKSSGAFHWPNTSRIRFWAFSYSMGEPCGRSNQLSTYFIGILLIVLVLRTIAAGTAHEWANLDGSVYVEGAGQQPDLVIHRPEGGGSKRSV